MPAEQVLWVCWTLRRKYGVKWDGAHLTTTSNPERRANEDSNHFARGTHCGEAPWLRLRPSRAYYLVTNIAGALQSLIFPKNEYTGDVCVKD